MNLLDHRRRAPGRSFLFLLGPWTIVRWLVSTIFTVLWGVRYFDRHRVPRTGPIIYVSNHQTHFDPPLISCLVGERPCGYMARASLFKFKPFGALIRWLGAIPLARRGADSSPLRAAIDELSAGRAVLIFPEGTRTRHGAIGQFRPGFLFLARKTGAQIVPVAMDGGFDAWPVARSWPRIGGRIWVAVCEPFAADELLPLHEDEALDRVRTRIEHMRLALRSRLHQATDGTYPKPGPGDVAFWEQPRRARAIATVEEPDATSALLSHRS